MVDDATFLIDRVLADEKVTSVNRFFSQRAVWRGGFWLSGYKCMYSVSKNL